ncbi:hypothetical protein [Dyadobacter pollutisoli]|uniref:Uncharacterized protein n=1 Tax=Dyadobacter pollutisoli TaxID=2910158 RepID=A0A9E8NEA6_9BACT|nr:hypothetical protein [Dyadobacter pollutisoli]WAC14393.1 hypothetical protein ON006_10635 [Dyadobacter pollutisoli]
MALFLTGDGAVRFIETFGNVLLLLLVLAAICGVIKFMHQE